MALIACKDCKKEFSTDAKCCPHCGAKKKGRSTWWIIVALILWYAVAQHPANSTFSTSPNSGGVVTQKATNEWNISETHSQMDDSKTVTLAKDSANLIDVWLKKVRPTLVIRCLKKKTDLYMITGSAAQPELGRYDQYTVELRIDEGKPFKELWSESTDSHAMFAANARTLVKRLFNAKRLLIRFTPFNASPTTAEFDVSGLERVLPKVEHTCKWNP